MEKYLKSSLKKSKTIISANGYTCVSTGMNGREVISSNKNEYQRPRQVNQERTRKAGQCYIEEKIEKQGWKIRQNLCTVKVM